MEIVIEGDQKDIWQNFIKIKGYNLKKIKLVPVWEISTEKTSEAFKDATGNIAGYSSKITKVSTVRLYPEDSNKKDELNAKSDGKEIKKTG